MANKIYTARETSNTWTDSTGDSVMTLNNLAAGVGRVGAQWDRGAGSLPALFEWRILVAGFATAPVVGEVVKLYFALSDGTNIDGIVATTDTALGSDILPNLYYAGAVAVRSTTTTDDIVASGHIYLPSRYISAVLLNDTADNLEATSNAHKIILTPLADEVQ